MTIADAFDSGATALSTIKAPVDIRLTAEDWRLLPDAAERVKAALQSVPGLSSVSVSWDANTSEASLVLNEDKLRALGLAPDAVLAQLPLKGAADRQHEQIAHGRRHSRCAAISPNPTVPTRPR